jgi:acyl-coenzyme A thioesterase PaaI-like protein
MSEIASEQFTSQISNWLKMEPLGEGLFKTNFQVHHIGNVFIRSLHGGVTGATIEMAAEALTREQAGPDAQVLITSSATDYLRITKDVDLYARASIQRISRRVAVVDVMCWQDDENIPVARGVVTLKIDRPE